MADEDWKILHVLKSHYTCNLRSVAVNHNKNTGTNPQKF